MIFSVRTQQYINHQHQAWLRVLGPSQTIGWSTSQISEQFDTLRKVKSQKVPFPQRCGKNYTLKSYGVKIINIINGKLVLPDEIVGLWVFYILSFLVYTLSWRNVYDIITSYFSCCSATCSSLNCVTVFRYIIINGIH